MPAVGAADFFETEAVVLFRAAAFLFFDLVTQLGSAEVGLLR